MSSPEHQSTISVDDSADADSTIGDDESTLTQSLRSSLLQSVEENGRGYHRYKSTATADYPLPEDEGEQERLDLQHEQFLRTFGGKLHQCPLGDEVHNVLDLGTGTGIWSIDFADEHPEALVLGTDLSPIQSIYVPSNCSFEVDDFNNDFTFNQKFDFIHARALVGASQDYPKLIRQSYGALSPGGWLEMSDVQMPFEDEDGTMSGTALETWNNRQVETCAKVGVDTRAASKNKQWMIDAGFEDVTELRFKWPVGTWPKDKALKELGKMTMINFLIGLEGFTLRLWTGVLGLSYEEVIAFLTSVRKDVTNPKIHSYWPV